MALDSTTQQTIETLQSQDTVEKTSKDKPNYWLSNPRTLLTSASIDTLLLGTGETIYSAILPKISAAEHEVILATCFWARSPTLYLLNDALRTLSAKAQARGRLIRVGICFSSTSLWQTLLHSLWRSEYVYPPATWHKALGLPPPEQLKGLDLRVKRIFVWPFCVMHPKFIIVDRSTVFLPSCNVSWEKWFEGCVELRGKVVDQFILYWEDVWGDERDVGLVRQANAGEDYHITNHRGVATANDRSSLIATTKLDLPNVPALFLPSPHHRNPLFRLPWQHHAPPPPTPLNVYLLKLFAHAERTIYLQTPNLTSPPVLAALTAALERGVAIDIVTSENLMVLEQLVTAGTTTSRCVLGLTRAHRNLLQQSKTASHVTQDELEDGLAPRRVGKLRVSYYCPRVGVDRSDNEPVQSHLKLTIVDDVTAVFGSGNMDRASFYTSQELGMAIRSTALVARIWDDLGAALEGRAKMVYCR